MKNGPPDDVICLIRATARQREQYSWPAVAEPEKKKSIFNFLKRNGKEKGRWSEISVKNFADQLPLDYPMLPRALERLGELTRQAEACLEKDKPAPQPGLTVTTAVEISVWVGTTANFTPIHSNLPALRPRKGEFAPKLLPSPVSAAMLEAALAGFDTAATRERAAEQRRRMLDEVAQDATVLQGPVRLRPPLGFKK